MILQHYGRSDNLTLSRMAISLFAARQKMELFGAGVCGCSSFLRDTKQEVCLRLFVWQHQWQDQNKESGGDSVMNGTTKVIRSKPSVKSERSLGILRRTWFDVV